MVMALPGRSTDSGELLTGRGKTTVGSPGFGERPFQAGPGALCVMLLFSTRVREHGASETSVHSQPCMPALGKRLLSCFPDSCLCCLLIKSPLFSGAVFWVILGSARGTGKCARHVPWHCEPPPPPPFPLSTERQVTRSGCRAQHSAASLNLSGVTKFFSGHKFLLSV